MSIMVNGKEYVEKVTECSKKDIYMVRTYSAGVFVGEIVFRHGKEVEMRNARRIWCWAGAASLSELAMHGTSNPDGCKFPCEVNELVLTEVVEIIKCTDKAVESINSVDVWSGH